jgi:hypothetical protein
VKTRIQGIISMLVLSCIVSAAARAGAATTNFDVTNNGMASFSINGAANPTLTLTRGQTYVFNVTALGHPFWITIARGAGDTETNGFSDGVTGNGASPGTLTFVVPPTAPGTLFYQCAFHDPMGGTLLIVSPPPAVPAVSTGLLVALGALLVVSAVTALRRRAR